MRFRGNEQKVEIEKHGYVQCESRKVSRLIATLTTLSKPQIPRSPSPKPQKPKNLAASVLSLGPVSPLLLSPALCGPRIHFLRIMIICLNWKETFIYLEILKAMFGTSYCQLPEEKFNKYGFLYPFIPLKNKTKISGLDSTDLGCAILYS